MVRGLTSRQIEPARTGHEPAMQPAKRDGWRRLNAHNLIDFIYQPTRPPVRSFLLGASRVNRCYGIIKTANADRGFAHIAADHGPDVFVHVKIFEHASLAWPPKIGARYSFNVEPGQRGLRALDIVGE